MLRAALVASLVVLAGALAGCTDKLSLGSTTAEDFTLEPTRGDKDTVFTVVAGSVADGRDVTWDWGDGTVSKGPRAEHRYGFSNGVMNVTMFVAGDETVVASKTVTLGSGVNKPPTATARAQKSWVEVGKMVNVTATGSDGDRDPLKYLWTYTLVSGGGADDGHGHAHGAAPQVGEVLLESTTNRASVVFDAPGRYDVKVRVKDPKGGEAVANTTVDVSRQIPDAQVQTTFTGRLVAGTAGAGVAEKAWVDPAPDSHVDAARHPFTLKYPATVYVFLTWNDTSNASAYDLDMELRNADTGETVFKAEHHAVNPASPGPPTPMPPLEINYTAVEPGNYEIVVRAFAGAQVDYAAQLFATLKLTPELVAAVEGS